MQHTVQLFTAQNGLLSAKAIFPDRTVRHIHSLVDPAVEAVYHEKTVFWGDVIVFAGLGLGYHISPIVKSIPPSALIIACDYDDMVLTKCKETTLARLPNRIQWISSSNAGESAARSAALISGRFSGPVQVVKHPASFDIQQEFYRAILDKLIPPARAPAARSRHGALVMYGNHFLEEEVRAALQVNDVGTSLFRYNECASPADYEDALLKLLQKDRPSFVVSINMKGIDNNGVFADAARRFGIAVFVWFVDDPRRIIMPQQTVSPSTLIAACWEKSYVPWLKTHGFSEALYLPLATDPTMFPPQPLVAPAIPLGFVGTAMVDEYAGNIREKFLWNKTLAPLVDEASEQLLKNPFYNVDDRLHDCAQRLSMRIPFSDAKNLSWLCAYIINTASMKKRKRIIGGLLDDGMETFGDPAGWKQLLGTAVKTHPDVDYRKGLCNTYRTIAINVNVTSCQMPSAINQRLFDIPCCGGFVISDDQKDLHDLFDVGREVIVYETIEDAKEKIRFYRMHDDDRTKIVIAAQKRILREHTYVNRVCEMARFMKGLRK